MQLSLTTLTYHNLPSFLAGDVCSRCCTYTRLSLLVPGSGRHTTPMPKLTPCSVITKKPKFKNQRLRGLKKNCVKILKPYITLTSHKPKNFFWKLISVPWGLYLISELKSCIPLKLSSAAASQIVSLHLMVVWLLTGTPERRYWQNRDTTNIRLDTSVGIPATFLRSLAQIPP